LLVVDDRTAIGDEVERIALYPTSISTKAEMRNIDRIDKNKESFSRITRLGHYVEQYLYLRGEGVNAPHDVKRKAEINKLN
jgi:hypothetical protein